MYTIKEASSRSGVPIASLRAWERRYGVVVPRRTTSGYRLYDDRAIAALSTMRRLVDTGWSPSAAAEAVASGEVSTTPDPAPSMSGELSAALEPGASGRRSAPPGGPTGGRSEPSWATTPPEAGETSSSATRTPTEAEVLTQAFVDAAAVVDVTAIESVLDRGFALGTFEAVVDTWLMGALHELGEAWAAGRVDVAGEHAASYAVMRRLGQSFAAASSLTSGPRVLVGLPSGCHHELGALAFATAARRRGLPVVYVGADLPVASWQRALQAFPTRVAVLAVPTAQDRPMAIETVRALRRSSPETAIAAGGAFADDLDLSVVRLPSSMAEAARVVEGLTS